ncbi:hemophore-related protein [Mycolicibacterium confluentis]|uniref:hemophore-related protein n=1 Tax=Mycolicibacterium confluentis TaxID=28047 RepID=UPI001F28BB9B|nr:hemophore-related protein [Mycolicibacterium confluentis]
MDPIVNTTCNYDQVISALSAQNPMAASMFNASPQQQDGLRQFLAAPPAERQTTAEAIRSAPANQPYLPIIQQAFSTCNSF